MTDLHESTLLLFGVIIPMSTWLCVAVCTTTLYVKLRASTRWRQRNISVKTTTGLYPHNRKRSAREDKATQKVMAVAVVLMICSLPSYGHLFTGFLVRDYFVDGALRYLYQVVLMAASWMTSC
ncbi:hypothetical protein ElyMa_003598900 [Elysia marginata]|uniref:G-protein coupled receptors family 1 profile domain-containing protein n=1 Tax=Elysia marginata TaxID=1093978 RepID=A0AAV4EQA4_9GAST|nr:hypothetical protein ElyMa_003598900 [Elysia marginata]